VVVEGGAGRVGVEGPVRLRRDGGARGRLAQAVERGAGLAGPGVAEQQVRDYQDTMAYLRRQAFVIPDRIGMTGYCIGGGVVFNVMAAEPTLRAAAPYYGFLGASTGEALRNTRAAALVVFGANDNLTNNIPAIEAALQAAGVPYRINVYPDAPHAFFNDTRPSLPNNGYVESAALAAWRDTLAWFATYLRGAGLPGTGDGSTAEEGDGEGAAQEAAAGDEE
jgi:carboxymethylenebutenolidase